MGIRSEDQPSNDSSPRPTVFCDQLWFYYTGVRGDASRLSSHWLENGMYDRGGTGVAFLRRDGFASMDAGQQTGVLTTRPVRFSGEYLFVNADCADGSLKAAPSRV